jgi:hypothetical protein
VGWFVKKLKSEKADLKELPLSGYSSRGGAGPTPPSWSSVTQCSNKWLPHFCEHARRPRLPRTCISSPKRADGQVEMRRLGIPHKSNRLLFVGDELSRLPRNLCNRTYRHNSRQGGWVWRHVAMRTDDLHCGSCSASTQFSIHSLPPLRPKAPHGPNSKAT